MAGHGQDEVVVARVHQLHLRAHSRPKGRQFLDGGEIGRVAPLLWAEEGEAVLEQGGEARIGARLLRACDRVAGNGEDVGGGRGLEGLGDDLLGAADVGQGRADGEVVCDLARQRSDAGRRRGDENEVRACNRIRRRLGHGVGEAKLTHAGAHRLAGVIGRISLSQTCIFRGA